jgi:hypothetical protein
MSASDQAYFYQIHLLGQLSQHWLDYFVELQLKVEVEPVSPPGLVISGSFKDQAALMGALQTLYNLGCALVSVERRDAPLR